MKKSEEHEKVSILMLKYNAPRYVYKSIKSLRRTKNVDYELIVVDNNSKNFTKRVLWNLYNKKWIDKLYFNNKNILFAGGNNIASMLIDKNSTHICLLNSDIEIRSSMWLKNLLMACPDRGVLMEQCYLNLYERMAIAF